MPIPQHHRSLALGTEQHLGEAAPPRSPAIVIALPITFHHSSRGPAGLTQERILPEPDREHQLSAAGRILLHQPISSPAPKTVRLDTEVLPAPRVSKARDSSHRSRSDCKSHFSSVQGSVLHVPDSPTLGEAELLRRSVCIYLAAHFGIVLA